MIEPLLEFFASAVFEPPKIQGTVQIIEAIPDHRDRLPEIASPRNVRFETEQGEVLFEVIDRILVDELGRFVFV